VLRRRFYPAPLARARKKFFNLVLPPGKKTTYHDYLLHFDPDRILFSLGSGDEIAQCDDDLMVFVRQTRIPFFVFCHALSFEPFRSERVKRNMIESCAKAAGVFFTSRMQLELTEQAMGQALTNARILNHPLTIRFDQPVPFPPATPVHFAMIGSLVVRWKGQDKVIRILSQDKWLERDWVLNIYGAGEDEQFLKSMAKESRAAERIVIHGHVTDQQAIWQKNHLLLIASSSDSGPITLFEAMHAGRPVVSTLIGAAPEYIQNNLTGVLATERTEEDLEKAMEQAWQHRERWAEWGQNARTYLDEHYDFRPERTLLNILQQNQ
ncbi:MAG: glycosyltransferase family 4 protein, partial [Armatimonadota bacterium]